MGWFNVISNSQTCRQFILFYYSFGAKILLTQENNNGHCTRGKVGDSHSIYYMYIIYHVLYHIIVLTLTREKL